jgi:hypothetical protein
MAFLNQPLSSRRKAQNPAFFYLIFVLMGLGFTYLMFVQPVLNVWAARSWKETTCRVLSSAVGTHSGKHGYTYSVDIVYRYRIGRQWYTERRYDFRVGSSSGYDGKEAVVEQYPPGKHVTCYYNPADPADAVLNRDLPADLFFGLIPMVFTLVGALGVVYSIKQRKQGTTGTPLAPAWMSGFAAAGSVTPKSAMPVLVDGKLELMPKETPTRNLVVGLILLAGVLAPLIAFTASQLQNSRTNPGDSGFIIVAVVFGLFSIVGIRGVVISIMRMSDPRVHLRVTPGTLRLGRDFTLEWEMQGGKRRLSDLSIVLQCCEESEYQAGKSHGTAVSVCHSSELVNTQQPDELRAGKAIGSVPVTAMHSFNGGRNRIVWRLHVIGKVPRWAGIKDDYPVVIMPNGWEATA